MAFLVQLLTTFLNGFLGIILQGLLGYLAGGGSTGT